MCVGQWWVVGVRGDMGGQGGGCWELRIAKTVYIQYNNSDTQVIAKIGVNKCDINTKSDPLPSEFGKSKSKTSNNELKKHEFDGYYCKLTLTVKVCPGFFSSVQIAISNRIMAVPRCFRIWAG